ncbi:hypothetical protein I3843_05G048800 [Carya illinoinensis]|uniref:Peroxidase n=1 Tax=Carya illinoinensis TaxID=32201 RepID=A0A922JNK6_CARIL|nr:hypothetical protein I3760_05G055800 [Carya illinoinensis]KAG6711472.1 hypothetical protein I3842_05G055300 [Carya illinoinensis]KAG7977785.1 hypothetical protein I3843_05G048800 [Carya illinoinensis]
MGQKHFLCLSFTLCFIVSLSPLIYSHPPIYNFPVGQLNQNFYASSCPFLLNIVRYRVWSALRDDSRMAASLLRLHFHDCIVNGCDASVLLDDKEDFTGEKNSPANHNSLRGFEVIDSIKEDLERFCPSTVSCADILTLAARDAVVLVGGTDWPVPLGRRDATTASQSAVLEQIPSPFDSLQNNIAKFASKGLDLKDVVVLSGGHTLGFANCLIIKGRIFDFKGTGKPDPTLESSFLAYLQSICPNGDTANSNFAPLDSSPASFDNSYFTNLRNNAGLLESDRALMGNPQTAALVESYSINPRRFSNDFAASMYKLGNVGVLTGENGEIRRKCRSVN